MAAVLSPPELRYKRSYIAAIEEFQQVDGRYLGIELAWLERNFESYLLALRQRESHPAPGRVPESVCWLVEGDHFLGRASLRHRLNSNLREIGGHIGYEIRPTERQKGFGRLLCKLTLEQAWVLGLERAMITCDETNVASRKIIEANGGVYEKSVAPAGHGVGVRHYWVSRAP
jgi:predicted acetyltransferase